MKILKDCKNSSVVWRSRTYVTYMLWNELVNWCLLDCCIKRYVLFKYFPSFRACKVLSNLVSTLLVHKSRCYMVIFYVIIMYLLTLLGLGRLKIKGEEEINVSASIQSQTGACTPMKSTYLLSTTA